MGEELLVGGVHLGEVGHVSEEDLQTPLTLNTSGRHCRGKDTKTYVDLDNLLHARSGSFHDSLDVVAAGLGQLADVTLDRVGGGVVGDLAGDEDLAVGADGLGLFGVSIFRPVHFWLGCVLWDSGIDVVVGGGYSGNGRFMGGEGLSQ